MAYNWRKHYSLRNKFDTEFNWLTELSGIYIWRRLEDGITYFYVGQAQNLKNRRFDYYKLQCGLSYPTRHFEASLKKHKDWKFEVLETCHPDKLDEREKYWIDYYNSQSNHITRNDMKANQDIVRSNAKRIQNVYNKYENNIKKMLKNIQIMYGPDQIVFSIKTNKNGSLNKSSEKAYKDFETWMEGLIENEN